MSSTYHEPSRELPPEVRDIHRALASLIEELQAVDWYHQRAALAGEVTHDWASETGRIGLGVVAAF